MNVINTGKVLIGSALVPAKRVEMSDDAIRLQSALLDSRTAKPRPLWSRIAGAFWSWA
jgi:hypothetical protein